MENLKISKFVGNIDFTRKGTSRGALSTKVSTCTYSYIGYIMAKMLLSKANVFLLADNTEHRLSVSSPELPSDKNANVNGTFPIFQYTHSCSCFYMREGSKLIA